MKTATFATTLACALAVSGCSWLTGEQGIFRDREYDYLRAKINPDLQIPDAIGELEVDDAFLIPGGNLDGEITTKGYQLLRPQQLFSGTGSNEVRLHRLGLVRWVYVEILPSSAWVEMKKFWAARPEGIAEENPDTGVLVSGEVQSADGPTFFEMRIEHGIRQASSEIFLTQHKMVGAEKARVAEGFNSEEQVLRDVVAHLVNNPLSKAGTSLVALNLNVGRKAVLTQTPEGASIIETSLSFERTWAAVNRAIKEAGIVIEDLDRSQGILWLSPGDADEKKRKSKEKKTKAKDKAKDEDKDKEQEGAAKAEEGEKSMAQATEKSPRGPADSHFKLHVEKREEGAVVWIEAPEGQTEVANTLLSQINQALS